MEKHLKCSRKAAGIRLPAGWSRPRTDTSPGPPEKARTRRCWHPSRTRPHPNNPREQPARTQDATPQGAAPGLRKPRPAVPRLPCGCPPRGLTLLQQSGQPASAVSPGPRPRDWNCRTDIPMRSVQGGCAQCDGWIARAPMPRQPGGCGYQEGRHSDSHRRGSCRIWLMSTICIMRQMF